MNLSQNTNLVKLRKGMLLGYAEIGNPNGIPLMFFHGFPGSRLDAVPLHALGKKLNIRIIAIDRPGFGLSTFQPNRRIVDWPRDVAELADCIKINRFAVLGFSGGGPYAAACANLIPERLTGCTIVSGIGEFSAKTMVSGMDKSNWSLLLLARFCPRLLALPLEIRRMTTFLTSDKLMLKTYLGADRILFSQNKELMRVLRATTKESFRLGTKGAIQEAVLLSKPWGFDLRAIVTRVSLWHGDLDKSVPATMAHNMAAALQNCTAVFCQDGHFSTLYNHLEEILQTSIQ